MEEGHLWAVWAQFLPERILALYAGDGPPRRAGEDQIVRAFQGGVE
jgi:hypothetical protein